MKTPPIPANEKERLEELRQYEVLDSEREKIFDDITHLARTICGTKISVISLIDSERQWFKSTQGLDATETPREISFCGHAINQDEIFEVEDALKDERFKNNPVCLSDPNVVFYAGAPLITPRGFKIGTLCVIDDKPGKLDATQRDLLEQLAKQVVNNLELRFKEKELALSHIKLDSIVNHIPVMLSLYNKKGEFIWCNKGWERELGWSVDEMRHKPDALAEFYPDPKEREKVLDFMMHPNSGWREFRTRKKSGDYIYTSWANVSLPYGGTIGIGKNIDASMKSQEATELLNQRMQMILRGAGLGSWDWWLDTNQVVFDELWCEMLGLDYNTIEMKLSSWQDRVHPDDIEQCFVDIKKYLNGETEFYENVHRMKHADGRWIYILDRGKISQKDQSGKPLRFTGTHFDLTVQKEFEQKLIDSKKKTEAIFETSNDAILLWKDGHLVDSNKRGVELFGFDNLNELLITSPEHLSPERQPNGRLSKELVPEILGIVEKERTHRFEWMHRKKNGEEFEADIMISSFEIDGMKIIQSTIRDISQDKRNERKNYDYYNSLLEMGSLDSTMSFKTRIQTIVKLASRVLDCSKVSYWKYEEDISAINSLAVYHQQKDEYLENLTFYSKDAPSYFKVIVTEPALIAHDVKTHEATQEMLQTYLLPENISSMLDQVVKEDEKIKGVLCFEHIGEKRHWSLAEQAYTKAVADIISIVIKDEEIKSSKVLLENVEVMAKIGGWEYNLKTKKQTWTAEVYKINDLEPGREVSVEEGISYYSERDVPRITELFKNCVEKGISYKEDFQITTAKKRKKWVRAKGEPVYGVEGKIESVRGVFQDITEMKTRELELSMTRDRLKRVVDSSPTVIYECVIKDDVYTTTYLSDQVLALTGYVAETFLYDGVMKFSELIYPDDRQACIDSMALAMKTDCQYEHRYRLKTMKGEIRWVLDKGKIDSKSGLMNGVLLDISHEVALIQNLRNVKEALDETAIIVFTDTQGVITYVNKKFEEVSGYLSHELVGETHKVIKSNEHSPEFFKNLWSTILQGKIWKGIIKNRNKSGEYYYVDTTIHPIKNEAGEIVEFLAVRSDVTQKIREENLNNFISSLRACFINNADNSRSFYDCVLQLFIDFTESKFGFIGEVLEDKNGPFLKTFSISDISWSPDIKTFYDENIQKGFEFKNLDTLFGEVIKNFQALISNNPPSDKRAGGLPTGHPDLNSFACLPIALSGNRRVLVGIANRENGYFDGFVDFVQPGLTVLGEMVEAIKLKESLRLQTMISEHNAKLASIGQLAAGVGHEINNPLAIIKGILMMANEELELEGGLSPSVKKKFEKIDISIDRIANIVKGLKTFSRSSESELAVFDLKDLLQEVQGLFSEIYLRSGINLTFVFDGSKTYKTFGNRGRIQQVLVNLISNARDALDGIVSPEVVISMQIEGNRVRIDVRDNGNGIPEEIHEKIFDPFFTTKDVNKGTGIGLSLVMTIMKEHGGEICFESNPGMGTSFQIYFLLSDASNEKQDVLETQKISPAKMKMRALVVDDEEDLREIMIQILSRLGLHVLAAANGQEALNLLKHETVDLIVSDSKMPIMNGLELLDEVHRLYPSHPPRFIMVSGDVNISEFMHDSQLKPDDILLKPFRIESIKSKIAALFPKFGES